MITENLSTLKINKLTQEQFDRELAAGNIDENAIYLTPDEEIDFSLYATVEQLNDKADAIHTHEISDVANLQSALDGKANVSHNHNSDYDTKGAASSALADAKAYTDEIAEGKADASHTHEIADVINLQSSLDAKQNTITGAATTITSSNLTANRALISNGSGKVAVSEVTSTELGYLDGVTSNVQTQLDGKADSEHTHNYAGSSSAGGAANSAVKLSNARTINGVSFDGTTNISITANPTSTQLSNVDLNEYTTAGFYFGAGGNNCTNIPTGIESFGMIVFKTASGYISQLLVAGNKETNTMYIRTYTGSSWTEWIPFMAGTNPTGTGSFSMNRKANTIIGVYSCAEGYNATASGNASHAEGYDTTASEFSSHAEGESTSATAMGSHAEGYGTTASGAYSHAEGYGTTSLNNQHAQGHYNNTTLAKAGVTSGTGTGTAFVIGNGTSTSASNAFRVDYTGKPYAKSTLNSSGADYAEFFEWQDLNLNAEDRRGYFVTLDGDKIKIAESNDYILGIISGMPSVAGNGDEDWMGRYIFDEFGAFVYEDFEYEEEVFDEKTGKTKTIIKTGKKYKENPEYDPTLKYIQREDRPEWDYVGMLGVLSVRDDGTCKVNGYCKVADGGIATASETGYRVIKRINDNIVKVIFR